jgi:hypothetical protein
MHRCDFSDFCIPNWAFCCSSSVSVLVVDVRAVLWRELVGLKLELLPLQQAVLT